MTWSPAETAVTPGPVTATIPARSLPCPDGNTAGHRARSKPSRIFASPGLVPAALTRTNTWPGAGAWPAPQRGLTRGSRRVGADTHHPAGAVAPDLAVFEEEVDTLDRPGQSGGRYVCELSLILPDSSAL